MTDYPLLFDIHPLGSEPPVPQRVITPGCLLPFPRNQEIDAARAGKILNLSISAITKLVKSGEISGYQLMGRGAREPWRISYDSVVEFCDHLRLKYAIRDRRPKLKAGHRWRDADLLPFPKSDTVSVNEVMVGLHLWRTGSIRLLEEGAFEAYRITQDGIWRLSKSSLYAYRDRKKAEIDLRKARTSSSRPPRLN